MKIQLVLFILATTLLAAACTKSDSSPEPDLTSQITGMYTLSRLTKKDGGATVTATGSATVTAVDKSTAKIRQLLSVSKSSSSKALVDYVYTYKVSQNGSSLAILQEYDINKTIQVGDVTGSKLTMTDLVMPGETPLIPLIAEFSK